MNAEIAICRLQQLFQFVESERFVHSQGAHDAEPNPLVNDAIEVGQSAISAYRSYRFHGTRRAG
jgi:hypothetical protein